MRPPSPFLGFLSAHCSFLAPCILSALSLLLAAPATAAEQRTIAIDIPVDAEAIAEALRDDGWIRWLADNKEDLDIIIGPAAEGDTEILVRPLPIDDQVTTLLKDLPVRLSAGVLELDGTAYRQPAQNLAIRLPRAEKTTWLISGYGTEKVTDLARFILLKEAGVRSWGRDQASFDYILRESPWIERSGVWRATETGFAVDRDGERNDFPARDDYYSGMETLAGKSVELTAPKAIASRPEIHRLARDLDAATAAMAKLIPLTLDRPVQVVIESDHVTQGRYLGDIGEAVLAADGTVHLVFHTDDTHAYLHRIASALIRRAKLEATLSPWLLEGAALWLSRQWFGQDFEAWLPRFASARLLPTADQLTANERQADGSGPLWVPVAASLVDSASGTSLRQKLAALPDVRKTRAHLARLALLPTPTPAPTSRPEIPFLDGISFAMLNRIDGGYHAPSVNKRLTHLAELGANAVSLMPFAYQPSPTEPSLRFSNNHPTSETDIGVLFAARQAQAAGFQVLWKPHIWISGESWPGDIAMPDEASWAAWWDSYRRYIAHHAFLADWAGCSLFSIGVELGKTVEREREWQELIATVRLLYSGAVTYSGNWHGDYERAPFWDRLDFVGVDAYFPLADSEEATPEALARGARALADRLRKDSERFGKPIILTEIGYAARTGAWVEPHREGGDFSAEHQALAYRALFEALGHPEWLQGIFAWKVFSAERGNPDRPDFRFLGRTAEAEVRNYFSPHEPATSQTPTRSTSQ